MWPITGIVRATVAGRSGGKYVGSFVRLSMAITEATTLPEVGCTIRPPDSFDGRPTVVAMPLICCWPLAGVVARVDGAPATKPFVSAARSETDVPRPAASVR